MPKVLLVEDDDMLRDMMQQTLELADHAITCAVNGADALDKARSGAPEVILMDITMPVMDGYEAIRRLKADSGTRSIPVIALTAAAGKEDRQLALSAGADEYESKPIDFDRLLQKMDALLQRNCR
jgi:CheY-like chemotaxis protein